MSKTMGALLTGIIAELVIQTGMRLGEPVLIVSGFLLTIPGIMLVRGN